MELSIDVIVFGLNVPFSKKTWAIGVNFSEIYLF